MTTFMLLKGIIIIMTLAALIICSLSVLYFIDTLWLDNKEIDRSLKELNRIAETNGLTYGEITNLVEEKKAEREAKENEKSFWAYLSPW